jgi:5-(carboxyamino)imidazole ribonucleotide synthase
MLIGILGGGQLGRMLALAGYRLGFRFRCFDSSPEAVAGQLMPLTIGSFHDRDALATFSKNLDLLTYEFENVPVAAADFLASKVPLYPPPAALAVSQDRIAEKSFFQRLGIPSASFQSIANRPNFDQAVQSLGLPAVLKTCRLGYDGKGQVVLNRPEDIEPAWQKLAGVPLILEGFIPFQRELSLLAVRGRTGQTAFYPLVENHHQAGILHKSFAPAPALPAQLQQHAQAYALRIFAALDYYGALAVEFFQVGDKLIANEMAPRVHNSGHWTIEGAATSQFENHLRAIAGLPLGPTHALGSAAMLNLLGIVPPAESLLDLPGVHLHVYGKKPLPGRKLGHITCLAPDERALAALLTQVETRICQNG